MRLAWGSPWTFEKDPHKVSQQRGGLCTLPLNWTKNFDPERTTLRIALALRNTARPAQPLATVIKVTSRAAALEKSEDRREILALLAGSPGRMNLLRVDAWFCPINNHLGDSESQAGATWYRKDRMFVSLSHFPHVLCGCGSALTCISAAGEAGCRGRQALPSLRSQQRQEMLG